MPESERPLESCVAGRTLLQFASNQSRGCYCSSCDHAKFAWLLVPDSTLSRARSKAVRALLDAARDRSAALTHSRRPFGWLQLSALRCHVALEISWFAHQPAPEALEQGPSIPCASGIDKRSTLLP